MTKPLAAVLAAALLAAAAAAPARAGDLDRDSELSFRLGGYGSGSELTIDGKERVADGGGMAGLRYMLNLDKNAALGVEVDGLNAGSHDSSSLMAGRTTHTELKHSEVLALLRGRFGDGHLRPYILGGLGLHTTSLRLDARPAGGSATSTLVDDKRSGLAMEVEGGLDYLFNRHVSAGVFLGLHAQSEQTYQATSAGNAAGLASIKGGFAGLALGVSAAARF